MLNLRPHKLYIKTATGRGKDEEGFPIPVQAVWGDAIPCHISTEGRELIYVDPATGKHTAFSYAVWLDPIPDNLTGRMVRLENQYGEIVEKTVQKCINRQLRTKLYL